MNVYGSQTSFDETANHMIIVGSYFDLFVYLMSGSAADLSLVKIRALWCPYPDMLLKNKNNIKDIELA